MADVKNAAVNFAINFVVGFGIASLVKDRKTGVKAGLVLGTVAAVAVLVFGDRLEELEEQAETEIEVAASASGE